MSNNKQNNQYPALNCKEVVRALEKAGAELKRQKVHAIYELHGRIIVSLCMGKKRSAWYTILYNSSIGLSKEDFYKLVGTYNIIKSNDVSKE